MSPSSLNASYRLVFNAGSQTWVPAPETARGRGKAGRSARRLASVAALCCGLQFAGLAPPCAAPRKNPSRWTGLRVGAEPINPCAGRR